MMELIGIDLLMNRARRRRCLAGAEKLAQTEHLFCANCRPDIYRPKLPAGILKPFREILRALRDNKEKLLADADARQEARMFLANFLLPGKNAPEAFLHVYLYLFWDEIAAEGSAVPPFGTVFFTSNKLDDDAAIGKQPLARIAKLIRTTAKVDLLSINPALADAFIIEVKRAGLDDRGVSQIQRYYADTRQLLNMPHLARMNVHHLRPVLILEKMQSRHWLAFPPEFREVLDVYEYRINAANGQMTLRSYREDAVPMSA